MPSDSATPGARAAVPDRASRPSPSLAGRRAFSALALGALAALAGCVVAPVGGYPAGAVVTVPPPAPQYEVIGLAPFVGAVWFGGYWNWVGGSYAWVPGYWGRPRPGYRWVPPVWHRSGPGWRQSPGYWGHR
jgi:hypothetical protein